MKRILFILFASSVLIGLPNWAYADFEAVESVMVTVEKAQKEAQNVQEKLKEAEAALNSARQGNFGPLEEIKSSIPNVKKVDINQLPSVAGVIGDKKELEKVIEKDTVPNYTDKNQNDTYQDVKDVIEAQKRENVSRLYAYALTLRTNMDKNRLTVKDDPIETKDSREILKQINKEASESARRVAQIVDMQSAIFEIDLNNRLISLSNKISEDEEKEADNKAEKGEK